MNNKYMFLYKIIVFPGVDWIDIVSESSYLWQYINSTEHVQNYTGMWVKWD